MAFGASAPQPATFGGAAAENKTIAASPHAAANAAAHGPPPAAGGPPPAQPAPGYGAPPAQPAPGYGAPPAQPAPGYGAPPAQAPQGYSAPQPVAQRPPYLASETDGRAHAPVEPWAGSLKIMMLIAGALLLLCFVAPWIEFRESYKFSWDVLAGTAAVDDSTLVKLFALTFPAAGILALALAMVPLSTSGRGVAAGATGVLGYGLIVITVSGMFIFPSFLMTLVGRGSSEARLFSIVAGLGVLAAIAGLLVRSQYRSHIAGRLLATAGAALLAISLVMPVDGELFITGLIDTATADRAPTGLMLMLLAVLARVLLVAVAAGLTWMKAPSSGAAGALFWVVLGVELGGRLCASYGFSRSDVGRMLQAPAGTVLMPIAIFAFLLLAAYGVATLVGKTLEQR